VNTKRGFRRLIIVIFALWVLIVLAVFPVLWWNEDRLDENREAHKELQGCYASAANGALPAETIACTDEATRKLLNPGQPLWAYYALLLSLWRFTIPLLVVPPALLYFVCRAFAWVIDGFKENELRIEDQ